MAANRSIATIRHGTVAMRDRIEQGRDRIEPGPGVTQEAERAAPQW
jgi:hypothetical protein